MDRLCPRRGGAAHTFLINDGTFPCFTDVPLADNRRFVHVVDDVTSLGADGVDFGVDIVMSVLRHRHTLWFVNIDMLDGNPGDDSLCLIIL